MASLQTNSLLGKVSALVDSPRGTKHVSGSIWSNPSPASTIMNRVNGQMTARRDSSAQQSVFLPSMSGDKNEDIIPAPMPRGDRLNLAKKKAGAVLSFDFQDDKSYTEIAENTGIVYSSNATSLYKDRFLDDYRSGLYRIVEEKNRFPIASIQVLTGLGRRSKSYRTIMPEYTRFMLEDVSISSSEKYQIHRTFRSYRINFFDGDPEVWTFRGRLLNTHNQNWSSEFMSMYSQFLRGSQCVKMGGEVFMTFEDIAISGYILNTSQSRKASSPNAVPFAFSIIITNNGFISSSPIINEVRKLGMKYKSKRTPIAYELVRSNFAKTYGATERRSGAIRMTKQRIGKIGKPSLQKEIDDAIKKEEASQPGR